MTCLWRGYTGLMADGSSLTKVNGMLKQGRLKFRSCSHNSVGSLIPLFHQSQAGAGSGLVPTLEPVLPFSTQKKLAPVPKNRFEVSTSFYVGQKQEPVTSGSYRGYGRSYHTRNRNFRRHFFPPSTKRMSENGENINEKSIQQWITDCPRGWDVQPVEVGDAPGKDTKRSKVRGQGPESPESNWFFIRIIYGPQIWAREMTKGMLWRKTVDGEMYLFYPEPSLIPNCTILYVCTFITTDSDVDTESGLGLSESWLLSKGDDTWGNLLSDVPVQSHNRFLVFWLDDRSMI